MNIREVLKDIVLFVPRRVSARRMYAKYKKTPKVELQWRRIFKRVAESQHVNVMFIASSLSMWRYGSTVAALTEDPRFSVHIVITPFRAYTQEEKSKNKSSLIEYFKNLGVAFTTIDTDKEFKDLKKSFHPNIIFYPQPYDYTFTPGIDWRQNIDCLLCYVPYFLGMTSANWLFGLNFHKALWRHYLPSGLHLEESNKFNNGTNCVVVGEVRADEFQTISSDDPWKDIGDGIIRKRLIWAPHFQLEQNGMFNRPDFLWTADIMLELAKKYHDKLQIAFKPHPRLKTKLYGMQDWGKDLTDEYYMQWESMNNTQVEEGEYVDLFKTSDAMIHNCGSFSGEYLYTRKPVAYISKDIEVVRAPFHSFGKRCVDAHYVISSEDEIERFIVDVVLNGNDTLSDVRQKIYDELLTTPNDRTVGENIHEDLARSLGLA